MKSVFIAIAALAATVVSAQNNIVSITSPLMNTVYTAGQDAVISWIKPTVDTIPKIMLAKGDPLALEVVATIAENVDAKKGSYTWKIPADTAPGNDYAFELGVSPDMSFSGMFSIKAAAAAESSSSSSEAASTTTTTTTRTTTSAAVSSAVSSATSVVASATSVVASATSSVASVASSAVSSVASAASSVASSAASTTPTPETEQPAEENAGNKMGSNKAVLAAIAGVAAAAALI
ncbi:hypothetical protein HPULCUR_011579 [Helicostylum pulchrum]|uniref:Yeast cell wall synthesis Kre9/Knh1-like N-terminal domain-containing protein n=1 Tax=Helicostylum pulchrum TaxID=562976 RepID=A0ABP9YGH1_9FUNG